MFIFRSSPQNCNLLRAYTFKYCYDQARLIQKSKNQNPQEMISNCLIIRPQRIKNETDFGYKQELKTNILKKIHFVYLQTVTDLLAFLWTHVNKPIPQFGMIFIENVDLYFGDYFEYRECGKSFLIFVKLLKQLCTKLKNKGRISFSYICNPQIFKKEAFEEITREEDFVNWEISETMVTKNGEKYESDQIRMFYMNYVLKKE